LIHVSELSGGRGYRNAMKFATARLLAVLLLLAIAGGAQAGDDDDHEQALRALREGREVSVDALTAAIVEHGDD
jgi:hypothetical protein